MEPVLMSYALFMNILIVNMKGDWKLIFNYFFFRLGARMGEHFGLTGDACYLSYTKDVVSSKQLQPALFQLAGVSPVMFFSNGETDW